MTTAGTHDEIRLRALDVGDLERLRSFVNDSDVMQLSNTYRPISDLQQEAWWKSVMVDSHSVWFGIQSGSDHTLIGTCCLVDIEPIAGQAELRIRIGARDAWGRSSGHAACVQLVNYGFRQLNLNRIWLRAAASHVRARKLYAKLGFIVEGELRNATYLEGKLQNVIMMGLLRQEWKETA